MDKELIQEILDYVEQTAEDFASEFDMGQSFEQQLKEPYEDGTFEYIPEFYFKLKELFKKQRGK